MILYNIIYTRILIIQHRYLNATIWCIMNLLYVFANYFHCFKLQIKFILLFTSILTLFRNGCVKLFNSCLIINIIISTSLLIFNVDCTVSRNRSTKQNVFKKSFYILHCFLDIFHIRKSYFILQCLNQQFGPG